MERVMSRFLSISLVMLALTAGLAGCQQQPEAIPIGALHALTGTMAASESPLVDAMTLAVEELNDQGGLLGRPVALRVADGRSDWEHSAREAERLIQDEKVAALFGCWTSACRQAVAPVVARHRHLLFYPLQYEGLESSPHLLYTGSVPNQQIIPAALWALETLGKRLYLVGSDYIFPRTAHHIITDLVQAQGGTVVAERYLPMGSADTGGVVAEIMALQPDVVLNSINGDTNLAFFRELHHATRTGKRIPVLSFSLPETDLARAPREMAGHFAAWSYFQGIDTPRNRVFVSRFQERFGRERVVGDAMEAAYLGVMLWANAVREANSLDLDKVDRLLMHQSLNAPQGIVSVDPATRHLWRTARIGRADESGRFTIVWSSGQPIRPSPFPLWLLDDHGRMPVAMNW